MDPHAKDSPRSLRCRDAGRDKRCRICGGCVGMMGRAIPRTFHRTLVSCALILIIAGVLKWRVIHHYIQVITFTAMTHSKDDSRPRIASSPLEVNFKNASTSGVVDPSLSVVLLGDWGGAELPPHTTAIQLQVAEAMEKVLHSKQAQAFISVGDNFYWNGVSSVSDIKFQEAFENVYKSDVFQKPWYLVAGNHDYFGNVEAQLKYSTISKRWNFPDYFYTFNHHITGKGVDNTNVSFIMIDTEKLCPDESQYKAGTKHWKWLHDTLNASTGADYIFVVGHLPVYSLGDFGNTPCLQEGLLPLLHQHRVSAYVCGHNHVLEHIVSARENHTVHFIVSGQGSQVDTFKHRPEKVRPAQSRFFYNGPGGFVTMMILPQKTLVNIYDSEAKSIYGTNITSRG